MKPAAVICGLVATTGIVFGSVASSDSRLEGASDVVVNAIDGDSEELVLAGGVPPSADAEQEPAWFNVHVVRPDGPVAIWFNVHRLGEVMLSLPDGARGQSGASREGLPIL